MPSARPSSPSTPQRTHLRSRRTPPPRQRGRGSPRRPQRGKRPRVAAARAMQQWREQRQQPLQLLPLRRSTSSRLPCPWARFRRNAWKQEQQQPHQQRGRATGATELLPMPQPLLLLPLAARARRGPRATTWRWGRRADGTRGRRGCGGSPRRTVRSSLFDLFSVFFFCFFISFLFFSVT